MINAISKSTQIKPNNLSINIIGKDFNSKQNSPPESKNIGEDKIDISHKRNLDFLRVEATILKNELPGIIANYLLSPLSGGAVSKDPLNSILSRLVNPAKSLLGSMAADNFSKDQLLSFQSGVKQLGREVSKMSSSTLLLPLNRDAAKSNALNGILNSISNKLIGLADFIQKSL